MRMIFLLLAVVSLAVALIGHSNPLTSGFGKALAGTFFIIFYIMLLFKNVKA